MISWKEPKGIVEWNRQLNAAVKRANNIKIPAIMVMLIKEDPTIQLNEVSKSRTSHLNVYTKLSEEMKRVRILVAVMDNWYETRKQSAALAAGIDRETYYTKELREAYRDEQAEVFRKRLLAVKAIHDNIKSERSRIWKALDTLDRHAQDVKKVHYYDH